MEEEGPKVITATKVEKVKDPRRVELGKRLGAISKEAKARKARERQEQQQQQQEFETLSPYLLLAPAIAVTALGGYWYLNGNDVKGENAVRKEEEPVKKEDNRIPRLELL